MFGKSKENEERKRKSKLKKESEKGRKFFKKFQTTEITPQTRYEIVLREGIYLKKKEENISVKGIKHLRPKYDIKEISDKDIQDFWEYLERPYPEETEMGITISYDEAQSEIGKINDRLKSKINPSIDEVNEVFENLAIILKYIIHITPPKARENNDNVITKNIKSRIPSKFKTNYIKQLNDVIVKTNFERSFNKLDADYYVRFLKAVNYNYGGELPRETLLSLVEEIGKSNNNEEILDFVKELEASFNTIKAETVCDVIKNINDNIIITPEKEEELLYLQNDERISMLMKGKEKRNTKLVIIEDILHSIDFAKDEGEEAASIIKRLSSLTPQRLKQFWTNYSNEISSIETANERLDNYLDNDKKSENIATAKRTIKMPQVENKQGKNSFKRKVIIASAVGIGALVIGGTALSNTMKSNKKENNDIGKEITVKLETPIHVKDTNFLAGREIKISKDTNQEDDIVLIIEDDTTTVKLTEDQVKGNKDLQEILEGKISSENVEER